MVRTRSGGSNSLVDQSDSKYDINRSFDNLHKNSEYESIISTRRQKRIGKLNISGTSLLNGHSDEDFVKTRRSFSKVSICKNTRNQTSFEHNHKYQQSLRHSSVDNGVMLKRTRDRSSHSRSLRSLGLEEEVSSCEEEDGIGALATSSRPRSTSRETFPNMLLRRSSRQKKTVYSTLNASTLEHAVMLDDELEDESPRPRKKSHSIKPELRDLLLAQGKDPDDIEALSQPDIYNSIKSRKRQRRPRRFFDEMMDEVHSDDNLDHDPEDGEEEQKEEDNDENAPEEQDDEIEQDTGRKYSLRTKRAQPLRLVYEIQRQTRQPRGLFDHLASSPAHRRRNKLRGTNPASPYQRRQRRTNSQGASSTSSSDSDSDERKFQNRKKKSMTKARNRCLPMNLTSSELATHGFAKERRKIGSSLADVDPMNVDKTIKFNSIGGHKKHVRALKEMIVFPLLYPEVFQKFHINPPRGCLFYGPPGNGKTLMARALANECSSEGRKVAFFMRKGADCLSKWVGESERQLRLLFDQAYQMRPSIIFFDEIDGLAPVRSSRQDQIHSSIVSTLLGLMDGLDNRGEIIVIGATNRIDSIDPALRRPGRFDREFAFPPPDKETRREIFQIHTQKWSPPLSSAFLDDLAEKTTGYCGADIMTLCAESALFALRRRYPQIYSSDEKLQLDISTISIQASDFYKAMKKIVPSSQRSNASPRSALNPVIRPLLTRTLDRIMGRLAEVFPIVQKKSKILKAVLSTSSNHSYSSDESEYDDDTGPTMIPIPVNGLSLSNTHSYDLSSHTFRASAVCRPRLLISGRVGDGHITHLAPAILHDLEGMPVHLLDLPNLHGFDVRSPEEACAQVFREARRTAPSIVYIPNARRWWQLAPPTVRHTFQFSMETLPVGLRVLILAASNTQANSDEESDDDISKFFVEERGEFFSVDKYPSAEERLIFFAPIFLHLAKKPPTDNRQQKSETAEVLPKAAPPEMAKLTPQELEKIELAEESTMRSLRLFLRDVLTRLAQDRRFKVFLKPVDTDEVPDYTEVIAQPMDISTMMNKIDQHQYHNVAQFASDINLICSNALEYNPDRSAEDRAIRHRACLLKDIAHAIIEDDLDLDFEKLCNDIIEARRRRKADPLKFAPKYYKVLPKPLLQPASSDRGADNVDAKKQVAKKSATTPNKKKRRRSAWASGRIKKPRLHRKAKVKPCEGTSSQDDVPDDTDNDPDVKTETDPEIVEEATVVDVVVHDVPNKSEDDVAADDDRVDSVQEKSPKSQLDSFETDLSQTSDASHVSIVSESQENRISNGDEEESTGGQKALDNDDKASLPSTENKEQDVPVDESPLEADPLLLDDADVLETEPTLLQQDVSVTSLSLEQNDADRPMTSHTTAVTADLSVVETLSPRMTLRSRARSHKEKDSSSNNVTLPPPIPLVVDEQKLQALLNSTVLKTEKLKVESLEEVYSALVRCVRRHRHNYDKTALTQELEEIVNVMSKL